MSKTYQKSFPGGKNTGFTLIELLVVVLIIGILAGVALPQYEKAVARSRMAEEQLLFRSYMDAQQRFYLANGRYTADPENLDISLGPVKTADDTGFSTDKWRFWITGEGGAQERLSIVINSNQIVALPILTYWAKRKKTYCVLVGAKGLDLQRFLCEGLGGTYVGACGMGEGECYELK